MKTTSLKNLPQLKLTHRSFAVALTLGLAYAFTPSGTSQTAQAPEATTVRIEKRLTRESPTGLSLAAQNFLLRSAIGAKHSLADAQAEEGFKSLFNGKDLTGWEGNMDLWSVKDGTITGITKADPKLTHNTFLVYSEGPVNDFELRLSYRIEKGNSGIQYRSKVLRKGEFGPVVGGYQADFEAGKTFSGILYEEQGRGILAQRGQKTVIKANPDDATKHKVEVAGSLGKSEDIQAKIKHEDWNDYVVIAQGNHLQHFINGMQTVDVVDEHSAKAAKEGTLALQIHTGPPMTVQFKNIRIKSLK